MTTNCQSLEPACRILYNTYNISSLPGIFSPHHLTYDSVKCQAGQLKLSASTTFHPISRQTHRQTHRCTQPFTPFGAVWRFAAALWRRLGAPSRAPLLCWLHGQAGPLSPGGVASAGLVAALAGSFVVSVGSVWTGIGTVPDAARHLQYHGA